MSQNPLIVLSIEIRKGHIAQLIIYNESDPQKLAEEFISLNGLPLNYVNPIKQNIIKQMCLYDALKSNKDNHMIKSNSEIEVKTHENENKSPKKQSLRNLKVDTSQSSIKIPWSGTPEKTTPQQSWIDKSKIKQTESDTDKEFDIYQRLYMNSKELENKKYLKYQQEKKKKEQTQQNDPNLTFKPVINKRSQQMINKKDQMPKSPTTTKNRSPTPTINRSPTLTKNKSPTPTQNRYQNSISPFKPTQTQSIFIPKSPRLNNLYTRNKHEVKISILENQHSFSESSDQPIIDQRPKVFLKALQQPVYTEYQIENSFSDFMKKEFQVKQQRG